MDLASFSLAIQLTTEEPEPDPLPVHLPIEDADTWNAIFEEIPDDEE